MDWRVHITEDITAPDGVLLHLYRYVGDEVEHITRIDSDTELYRERVPLRVAPEFTGLRVPHSALEAIAEKIRPGPDSQEVARLEEALGVERSRVDRMISVLLGGADPRFLQPRAEG